MLLFQPDTILTSASIESPRPAVSGRVRVDVTSDFEGSRNRSATRRTPIAMVQRTAMICPAGVNEISQTGDTAAMRTANRVVGMIDVRRFTAEQESAP